VSEIHENEELLVGLVHGGLDPGERARVEEHVAGCDACRAAVAELRKVGEALRALPAPASGAQGEARLDQAKARTYAAVIAAMERGRAQPIAKPKGRSLRPFLVLAVSLAAGLLVTTTIVLQVNEEKLDLAKSQPRAGSPAHEEARRLETQARDGKDQLASRPAAPAPAPAPTAAEPAAPTPAAAPLAEGERRNDGAKADASGFGPTPSAADEAEVERTLAAAALDKDERAKEPGTTSSAPGAGAALEHVDVEGKKNAGDKALAYDRAREKTVVAGGLKPAKADPSAGEPRQPIDARRAWIVRADSEPARVLVLRGDGTLSWGPIPDGFRSPIPPGPGVSVLEPTAITPEIASIASGTTEPGDYAALRSVLLLEIQGARKAPATGHDVALRTRLDALAREANVARAKLAHLEVERKAAESADKAAVAPAPAPKMPAAVGR
jgi:hypothetical protein